MLHKKHRLAKTKDIQQTFARGRSFFYPLFSIKFAAKPSSPRFTVVVSTKVSKKAVVRNRIKRVLRETIRLALSSFVSGDYVIMVRPQAAKATAAELREQLKDALAKAKLVKA